MTTSTVLALLVGTLVSEDLTCVAAGVLIAQGRIDPLTAVAACMTGIYVGDLGLFIVGRVGGVGIRRWHRVQQFVTPAREAAFGRWFALNAAAMILGSRFLPGARLPLYVAAGAFGGPFALFARWSLLAVVLWAPSLVLVTAHAGRGPTQAIAAMTGSMWSAQLMAAATVLGCMRVVGLLWTARGRQRLMARISRVWRWEFWPMWLFYAPVAAWTVLLAIRHGGYRTITAANPGIADGGLAGESKQEILRHLPDEWTLPSFPLAPGTDDSRMWTFLHQLTCRQWNFPVVLKPDVGQRGAGVKRVCTAAAARSYLEQQRDAVIVQQYHPGPFEAGVFYYRWPGAERGRILSVTDKHFPVVVGDGRSTLEDLIWADSRLRMQARTFLRRHATMRDRVLARGERLALAFAGNHAQGTLFRDGSHLITPALEERIDRIARLYEGFFIGRFDIRYSDVERFKAGEDLAIVELNGATAESTNIYDPDKSLLAAYRTLFHQWQLVFAIGAANRAAGAVPSSATRVLRLLHTHLTSRVPFTVSD